MDRKTLLFKVAQQCADVERQLQSLRYPIDQLSHSKTALLLNDTLERVRGLRNQTALLAIREGVSLRRGAVCGVSKTPINQETGKCANCLCRRSSQNGVG